MQAWERALDARIAEAVLWSLNWEPGKRFVPAGALDEITARNNALRASGDDAATRALLAQVPLLEAQIARFSVLALTDDHEHAARYLELTERMRQTLLTIQQATVGWAA